MNRLDREDPDFFSLHKAGPHLLKHLTIFPSNQLILLVHILINVVFLSHLNEKLTMS